MCQVEIDFIIIYTLYIMSDRVRAATETAERDMAAVEQQHPVDAAFQSVIARLRTAFGQIHDESDLAARAIKLWQLCEVAEVHPELSTIVTICRNLLRGAVSPSTPVAAPSTPCLPQEDRATLGQEFMTAIQACPESLRHHRLFFVCRAQAKLLFGSEPQQRDDARRSCSQACTAMRNQADAAGQQWLKTMFALLQREDSLRKKRA